ncbi:ABC transporter ATP-binding protein [Portibacter lacus]|uniref:Xenobiotic ABC transporter ATP-binding protein n=1 Tax=Portibacter lacus TaxID=1099794 RepID=A0AA37SP83_9BACT|nr:ABC transporter ATP-binding protein [Portibacter lacus]GLR16972.1 xenobiotic ABC transporter ATP-binding protein [Portibacter lacus]
MSESKGNKFDWEILKRILKLAKPYKGLFISVGILAVVIAPISAIRPYLINIIVDDHIFNNDIPGLIRMSLIFVAAVLAAVILQYIFIYSVNLLGQQVIRDLRVRVFNHILSLKLRFFDTTPIGTITTRTINDVEAINNVFAQGVVTIVADILSIFAVLGLMFFTSVKLTLICLITMPLMMLATYVFKEKVKASYQNVRTQISKMNAFLNERITGMRIVQIFNAEKQEREKFKKINRDYTKANLNAILYYAVFYPVVEIISALSLALLVWWGAGGYISGSVSFGALVAFPMYLDLLFRPIRMLADKFNTLQMGMVAADRVFKVLDNTDKIENKGNIYIEKLEGDIKFDDVSFSYDDENYVLHDINFEVKEGSTLAIVGSTGSGKSTIINILNRFYEIQKGTISINGTDIREFNLDSLRSRIAIVLQDVFLFNGNVYENISLRNEDISKEKIEQAAKSIGADAFLENLPDGYDYKVMERGANLSMGQRQLISFVRALVFDPDILILDEATSSIDTETEAIIQNAIEKLIQKRTSIIIAHRLSTIRNADKILVLDKGYIKEFGSHDELMKIEDGHYRNMIEMQFVEMH